MRTLQAEDAQRGAELGLVEQTVVVGVDPGEGGGGHRCLEGTNRRYLVRHGSVDLASIMHSRVDSALWRPP